MTRLLAAAALVAVAVLPAVPASATECTPRGCTASCHLNHDPSGPFDLFVCYS